MTPVRHLPCSTRVSLGIPEHTKEHTAHLVPRCLAWPGSGLVRRYSLVLRTEPRVSFTYLSYHTHTHTSFASSPASLACQSSDVSCARDFTGARHKRANSAISATCAPARPSPQRSEFVGGPACRSTAGANGRACCQSLLLAPKCKDFHLSPTARLVFPVSCHRSTNESPREISRTSSTPLERHRRSIVTGVSTSTSALQRHR